VRFDCSNFSNPTFSQPLSYLVGGPLEKSCRLEGLLDTVINRGKDLQKELDENNRIEESIRREINAELLVEPNHPVVTEAPRIFENLSPASSSDACEPTTPRSGKNDVALHYPRTPELSPNTLLINGRPSDLRDYENHAFPFTSHSRDNADLCGPGLPGYRRNETGYDFACGASLLGNNVHLFTQPDTYMLESAQNRRDRSNSSDGVNHPSLGPALTSSFDTIDFRTGMSGHRGLTNAKPNPGHSPTPRGARLRMSEHRGIGRARGPLQRSSASNSPL
jgi:hypothetical protein